METSWAVLPAHWANTVVATLAFGVAETSVVLLVVGAGKGNTSCSSICELLAADSNINLPIDAVGAAYTAGSVVEAFLANWVPD